MDRVESDGESGNGIEREEDLRGLYPPVSPLAVKKCIDRLDKHCVNFISLSPFLCIGTSGADSKADVSPRGDPPGFVQVLDPNTIAIPDRPGNNRLDTFSNVLQNPNVGILFMIPGIDETLRINGLARLSTEPDLLARMQVDGKTPKAAMVVDVKEAFLHCAKAFRRSKLWTDDYRKPRDALPTLGKMIIDQVAPDKSDEAVAAADARLEHNYKTGLY